MIDKIIFYVNDVDVDEIEKSLWRYGEIDEELDLVGLDRKRGVSKFGAFLGNAITINIVNSVGGTLKLKGYGSLHKFAKGNNYSLFTIEEAKNAFKNLELLLGVSLDRFVITNIEFGLNIQMEKDPMKYIDTMIKYKAYPFIYMKPLAKSSLLKGKVCKRTDYEIKFYDKTFEATHRSKHLKEDVPVNILRYEVAYSRKKLKQIGLKDVTAEKLFMVKSLHYRKLKKSYNRYLIN